MSAHEPAPVPVSVPVPEPVRTSVRVNEWVLEILHYGYDLDQPTALCLVHRRCRSVLVLSPMGGTLSVDLNFTLQRLSLHRCGRPTNDIDDDPVAS